jgi:hypothetical protein
MNLFSQNQRTPQRHQFVDAVLIASIVLMTFCYKLMKTDPQGFRELFLH